MAVISLKVSEQEKSFMQAMATFEGKTLSELIRNKVIEALEDEYDTRVADIAIAEHEEYVAKGGKTRTYREFVEELGLADDVYS